MRKIYFLFSIFLMVIFSACTDKVQKKEGKKTYENQAFQEKSEKKLIETPKRKWGDAPDFTLPEVKGGKLTLSEFSGKVIILDFWATWCPPCRKEIPDFIELYNEYNDKGLVIIGVSLDTGGSEKVERFIEDFKVNYPIVMGNNDVVSGYGPIRGIPTTFIIDKNGDVKDKIVGYRPKQIFESKIKEKIGE